jgi:hypothetical protein
MRIDKMNFLKSMSFILFLSLIVMDGHISHVHADERENMWDTITIPDEVLPLIPDGFYPIFLEQADLNKDKLSDYLIVLENNVQKGANNWDPSKEIIETPRPLIILQRTADGQLIKVKQNDKIVFCRICGGAYGDPFEDIKITKKGFTVNLYGGSNWRWEEHYEFAYSRIDKTWQLIKIESSSYHTSAPDDAKKRKLTPPKNFGKIDITDFDPEKFMGDGSDNTDENIEKDK